MSRYGQIMRETDAFAQEYESLDSVGKLELLKSNPERALRFINVFRDADLACAYIDVYPASASAYHLARSFELPIDGKEVLPKTSTVEPSALGDSAVSETLTDIVSGVNFFYCARGAARIHGLADDSPPSWDNIVRTYENDNS